MKAVSLSILALILTAAVSPALAMDAANRQRAVTACARRLHPGLIGENFREARRRVDLDWRMAELKGKEVNCDDVYAARHLKDKRGEH